MTLAAIEETAILDAIIEAQYHASNAAKKLDIARNTLTHKCKVFGILRTNGRGINPAAVNRRREELRKETGT